MSGPLRHLVLGTAFFLCADTTRAADRCERFLVYKVERIAPAQAPVIDGALDEPIWQDKAVMSSLRNFHGPRTGEFASQKSDFVLLTDGAKLYMGVTFHDDEMEKVRFNPAAAPFWNDCAEIYFDPLHDGTESIQLVVDCGGRKWWHKRFDRGYGWWDDSAWYLFARWDAATKRGAKSWTLEIAIDCASFHIDPTPGKVAGINLCRFRLGADPQAFSAWAYDLETGRQKAMHAWGHLLFLPAGQPARGAEVTRADVTLVYPDLTKRTIEVPTRNGFLIDTAEGRRPVTFREVLDTALPPLEDLLARTQAAVERLPSRETKLREAFATAAGAIRNLLADARAENITGGTYDRIMADLAKAQKNLEDQYWFAQIVDLVAGAHSGNPQQGTF